MINQYFNVYALRRVRTAGYATELEQEIYTVFCLFVHVFCDIMSKSGALGITSEVFADCESAIRKSSS